ncbi:MAG: 2-phospho-L-lactate transferase [Acidimicrobiales bacterium]
MPDQNEPTAAVICGGVGAARLLRGLTRLVPGDRLTAIVNVGDDLELHGLHISPDLDTITYTLADAVSPERGWGLDGETWQAMEMVGRYGGVDWFNLGDRDLGTHLYRTHLLSTGATLAEATAKVIAGWDLDLTVLPVTNDRLRTMVTTTTEGEIGFQEYFVRLQHGVPVSSVRFAGAETAAPAPGVLDAIASADHLIVAPSNPVVSIDPVLAVPGVRAALAARRDTVVGVSPIIGGKALKGPADRLLVELGREASAVAVAEWYRDVVGVLVIDEVDAELAPAIEALGVRCVVAPTIMSDLDTTVALAEVVLDA